MYKSLPNRPRFPPYYSVQFEPPDDSGEEGLVFTSDQRRIRLKGRSLREVQQRLIPLLDGSRSIESICSAVADVFEPEDVSEFLRLLRTHRLLDDALEDQLSPELQRRFAPQLHFLRELAVDAQEAQMRVASRSVAVVGLSGAGAHAALALARAGVGTIRCIDGNPVSVADPHLSPLCGRDMVGQSRAEVVAELIRNIGGSACAISIGEALEGDADFTAALGGVDLVLGCVDTGMINVLFKINRVCLMTRTPLMCCSVSGVEGIIGPTVIPYETPCYMCYQMRAVACTANPSESFTHLRFLDRRRHDGSATRENHVFGTGAVGHLLGFEAYRWLTGKLQPSTLGHIIVFDFLRLGCCKHTVLRKPGCPTCSTPTELAGGTLAASIPSDISERQ